MTCPGASFVSSAGLGSFYRVLAVIGAHFLTSISKHHERQGLRLRANMAMVGIDKRWFHLFFYLKQITYIAWPVKGKTVLREKLLEKNVQQIF